MSTTSQGWTAELDADGDQLHLLTKRRQDLVAARTQTINRLHRLLMDLEPGGARRNLTATATALLSCWPR